MENMKCTLCGNPLKVISGEEKEIDGKQVMIHVWGCLNTECPNKMNEVTRTYTEV